MSGGAFSDTKTFTNLVTLPSGRKARVILVWDGGNVARELPSRGELRAGRALECELPVDHSSVSRFHASLRLSGEGAILLEDLGSTNGTFINGVRLAPRTPKELRPGDKVDLGAVMLVVQQPTAISTEPEPRPPGAERDFETLLTTIARSELDVLLYGETGAGKEVAADRLHRASRRADKPLVKIHCAALPETMLEAELFGFERGAFTGAAHAKPGLLESANGGTVFLDEIGELTLATQVKLLRVLENREVQRVGGLRPIRLDVRFLAATHRDIEAEVGAGRFREDFYYRIAGLVLTVPALRERPGAIRAMAGQLLAEACARASRPPLGLSPAALAKLDTHSFPGNVRELKRVLERAAVHATGASIEPHDIRFDRGPMTAGAPPPSSQHPAVDLASLPARRLEEQRKRLEAALLSTDGNQTKAATLLGVSRRTLLNWMDVHGLPRPRKRTDDEEDG